MRRVLTSLVAFTIGGAVLGGCATTPTPTSEAKPVPIDRILNGALARPSTGAVPVTIKRDTGFMGSACAARVFVNGAAVAELHTGELVTVYLQPGDYGFGVVATGICGGGTAEMRTTIKSGAPLNVRVGSGQSGDLVITPTSF